MLKLLLNIILLNIITQSKWDKADNCQFPTLHLWKGVCCDEIVLLLQVQSTSPLSPLVLWQHDVSVYNGDPNLFRLAFVLILLQGAPSYVRLFQHPNFNSPGAVLANKSFFKADRVTIKWNRKGAH